MGLIVGLASPLDSIEKSDDSISIFDFLPLALDLIGEVDRLAEVEAIALAVAEREDLVDILVQSKATRIKFQLASFSPPPLLPFSGKSRRTTRNDGFRRE